MTTVASIIGLDKHLEQTEVAAIENALEHCNWKVASAARYLKVNRSTLWEKMKRLGIKSKDTPRRRK